MISLEISDGLLRFFELSRDRDGLSRPKDFGSRIVPEKAAEAKAALESFAKGRKHSSIRVVIPESEALVVPTFIHTTNQSKFQSYIEQSFPHYTPIPLADAVFDYDIVRFDPVRGGAFVSVSIIPKKSIEGYANILASVGLRAESFTTESHALAQALFPKDERGTHAVLHIGKKHSTAFIVDCGIVCSSASAKIGSDDIDALLAKAGVSKESPSALEAAVTAVSAIRDQLFKVLSAWNDEAKRRLYHSAITDIVLAGSYSLIPGFARYISLASGLPAKVGSVWTRMPHHVAEVPKLDRRSSLDYGAVIGAAFE